MPAVTVRNLSEEAHRALKARAAKHGRSTEAEIRDILEKAALPKDRVRLGSELAAIARDLDGFDDAILEHDPTPAPTVKFD
ncbi:FitA-like ribbon-helix-helix domain-containing protein [Xanthobacteraceae bacterium A53D]